MSKFKLQLPSFVEDLFDAAAETIVVGDRLIRTAKAASDHVANARPSATISSDGIRLDLGGNARREGASPSADASHRGRVERTTAEKEGGAKRARARKHAKQQGRAGAAAPASGRATRGAAPAAAHARARAPHPGAAAPSGDAPESSAADRGSAKPRAKRNRKADETAG